MFTLSSNARTSNLYLTAALALIVIVLTFAVMPAVSAAKPASLPVTGNSDKTSDYFLRHPQLSISAAPASFVNSDFYQRHPDWASSVANLIPITGNTELSDYFQRHLELSAPAGITMDTADYFLRHPDRRPSAFSTDLSDYFLRH